MVLVLFAKANWNAVTLKLWGGLEADVKLPVLVLAAFLLGFLPTFIVYRARLWSLRRRLEPASVSIAPARPIPSPVAVDNGEGERVATDSKVWPTA
ncbi:MAG TPA: hypothetical protein VGB57_10740 [Allosphingosinicella sp.]